MEHFGRAVGWEGYIIRVNVDDDDPLSLKYHTGNLLVKMEAPDIPDGHGADLGITLSQMNVEKFATVLDEIHIGDKIAFNATLISMGDTHHLHHLRAWGLKKIDGHMDLHAHAHSNGRYHIKQNLNETELSEAEKDKAKYY